MLRRLSRIFGIIGSAFTLLPYAMVIAYCASVLAAPVGEHSMGEGKGYAFVYLMIISVPALLSTAGFIISFFVRKKPLAAGIVMILSGGINLAMPLIINKIIPMIIHSIETQIVFMAWVSFALLLICAGVLGIISRFTGGKTYASRHPQSDNAEQVIEHTPGLRNLSRNIAIICGIIHMLPWAFLSISAFFSESQGSLLYVVPPFFVSTAGLLGSLLLRKNPVTGAVLILLSGGLVFFITLLYSSANSYWWICIPPVLLIASGVFALISARKCHQKEPQN